MVLQSKYFLNIKYLFLVALPFLVGCNKTPEYSQTPQIEMVTTQRYILPFGYDSLYLKLKFKDGDGNLGLNQDDLPNTEYDIVDTLKNVDISQYNCQNYISGNANRVVLRINRHPTYFNFFVSFYIKNPDDSYTPFVLPDCQQNNGRFSRFDPDPNYVGPLEGTIEWNFKGSFSQFFKGKTIQIGVQITDRNQNRSNETRSSDIKF